MSVVLHVGLPKSGTTFTQAVLEAQRGALAERGVCWCEPEPGAQFRAAVDVRGSADKFGLDSGQVAGQWARLCGQARDAVARDERVIMGHEVLAGASPDQIEAALSHLSGVAVEVVITARDLARGAVAHWTEEVKLGRHQSFADFEHEQFRADTGPGLSPDDGGERPHFWHAQDWLHAAQRWGSEPRVGLVHLVVVPPTGSAPGVLWRRFGEACGIDPATVPDRAIDAAATSSANPALGRDELALLRAMNPELTDRLSRAEYLRIVKRGFAERELAGRRSSRPEAPPDLAATFDEVTRGWIEQLAGLRVHVHGSTDELLPARPPPGSPTPPPPDAAEPDRQTVEATVERLLGYEDSASPEGLSRSLRRAGRRSIEKWRSRR